MESKWTLQEIADKADSEGGIVELMLWGLSANMIEDDTLYHLWTQLETMRGLLRAIGGMLPEPGDGE